MKTNIIFSAIIGLLFISCQGQKSEAVKNLSATEFAEKIKNTPDGQLIDVRTPGEYGAGNISNSRNIDWNGDQFEAEIATLDKSKPVLVYCKSGGRSGQAAEKLQKM